MKKVLLASAMTLGLVAGLAPAQASITANNGFVGVVPFANLGSDQTLPPWGPPQPVDGSGPGSVIYNANLSGPAGTYRLDYYGAEAAFLNEFRWTGALIFQNPGAIIPTPPPTPIAGPVFVNHAGGVLPFSFRINGNPLNELFNGANKLPVPGTPDFAVTTDPNVLQVAGSTAPSWHVWLDDGNAIDDDHDDMWVRVTHAVPTPAAVLLFGAGLLGLGLVRRRATQA